MILRALLAWWTSVARPMGDHLWQSTLFLAVAAILSFALRKNQARVRYWVWLTASVKFLIPFSLLIALGSHLAKPRVSTPTQAVVYSAVEDFSQPFAAQQMPVIYHPAPTAAPVSLLHLLPATLVAVWLVGIILVLLRWAIGWVRISLMVRKAALVSEGSEVDALRRLESSLGVRTPIRLVLSRDWMEPGIFGIFRPVLIWPEGISEHLDDRHIEAILAHEICHARRHDNLTAVLHMLVEAVFWFHPLVWWMGARLEEERERACDEEVSHLCSRPHVYAESILRVCKFCSESPLACVSGITGADLKKRIVQIMTERVAHELGLSRKLLLLAAALAAVAMPVMLGQVRVAHRLPILAQILTTEPQPPENIAGNWQGKLGTATSQRIILTIAKTDKGWTAKMYNIDRGPFPIDASSVVLDGSSLRYSVGLINGSYQGKVSADGKSIAGTWIQNNNPAPLTLLRATKDSEWSIPPLPPPPRLMPANADPSFDVETIKPNKSSEVIMQEFTLKGRHFTARNASLVDLISFAYEVQAKQIVRGPGWIDKDRYDIAAVPGQTGEANTQQLRIMIRKLLTERFKLEFHHERRELSAYILTAGKNGGKLMPTHSVQPLPSVGFQPAAGGLTLRMTNATLSDLAGTLQMLVLGRPVIDRTGITGRFDYNVTFAPDESQFNGHPPKLPAQTETTESSSDLSRALQEQLGLKLDAERAAVDVIAVDNVERPSPN